MATLAALRASLNSEIGVTNDAEASPWSTTVRNDAISKGYAELWRAGVWRPLQQDIATADDQWTYATSSIRRLNRLELRDSNNVILDHPRGIVEDDGTGGYRVRLKAPLPSGFTLRILGWTAFKSTFSGDADTDDLPAEHNRIPLLKAKAILYRQQLGLFARFEERQSLPPEMRVSVESLLAIIAAAEREFETEARSLAKQRTRVGQLARL